MDGKPYLAGRFALSLRKKLFREHLGLLQSESDSGTIIDDPVTDSFYKDTWIQTAAINTKIYDEVFHCIPCGYWVFRILYKSIDKLVSMKVTK